MTDERFFEHSLFQTREIFGPPPRRFGFWRYFFGIWIRIPPWLPITDKLFHFWLHQRRLVNEGDIVWGHLVQANTYLFTWGLNSLPGEVVFCTEPDRYVSPSELAAVARKAFRLKGTTNNSPGEQAIADHLTDELARVFGLPVPESLSPDFPCAVSTICFDRWQLPKGRIVRPFFPILVSRTEPKVAMVVPCRFWANDFRDIWRT